jgi:hypothetical protein
MYSEGNVQPRLIKKQCIELIGMQAGGDVSSRERKSSIAIVRQLAANIDRSSIVGRAMKFEILVFRNQQDLKMFTRASDSVVAPGISRRILPRCVLLICKKRIVAPDVWGTYCSAGFRGVCGDWIPIWNETNALHNELRAALRKVNAPFIEVFRGADAVIVCPKSYRHARHTSGDRSGDSDEGL